MGKSLENQLKDINDVIATEQREATAEEKAKIEELQAKIDAKAAKAAKSVKVKFLKSPTGAFKLAYNAGDEVSLPGNQVEELVKAGFASKI